MGHLSKFRRELQAMPGKVMAYQIRDGFGSALWATIGAMIKGESRSDTQVKEALTGDGETQALDSNPVIVPGGRGSKATAFVSIRGVALYDLEWQPYAFSTLLLARRINVLAADPEIGQIILNIDSPGGTVTGVPEAADAIFAARKVKPVIAIVNPLAASAAYWLASQATEIIAVPSAEVGSIGVWMLHMDHSGMFNEIGINPTFIFAGEFKIEGNPFEPLSEAAAENLQGEVDQINRDFIKAVARGRDVSVAKAGGPDFGKGRTMSAIKAKAGKMIDRIATADRAVKMLGVASPAAARLEAIKALEAMLAADLPIQPDDADPESTDQQIPARDDEAGPTAARPLPTFEDQPASGEEVVAAAAPPVADDDGLRERRRRQVAIARHRNGIIFEIIFAG